MFYKVAFIICQHRLETHSVLKTTIQYFINHTIDVDIYIDKLISNVDFKINGSHIYNFKVQFPRKKYVKKIFNKIKKIFIILDQRYNVTAYGRNTYLLKLFTFLLTPSIYMYSKRLKKYLKCSYDYYIVADAYSFLPLYLCIDINEIYKVIYWNLELLDDMPFFFIKNLIKQNIDLFYFSMIQDKERENSFNSLLGTKCNFKKVPVSLIPHKRDSKRDYFEMKLGIKNKFILLYSGYICSWAGLLEVVEVFKKIGEDFVFIIQGRTEGTESYLNQLYYKIQSMNNVFLLPHYLTDKEHNYMVASADAGLAIYLDKYQNDNFKYISNASMKIATYLSHGLPVITNKLESLQKLSAKSKCVFCLNKFSELEDTLKYIKINNAELKERSINYFDSYYNFEILFKKIYSTLGY